MKKTFLGIVLFVLVILSSCEINYSNIFETPFPFDEMNAYFDIPFDTVCFVSNTGDTIKLKYEADTCYYEPYEFHPGPYCDGCRETYVRRSCYKVFDDSLGSDSVFIDLQISVSQREISDICVGVWETQLYSVAYGEEFRMKRPSNEIFDYYNDTMTANFIGEFIKNDHNNYEEMMPDDNSYAILVRGKGVTEFSLHNNTVIWRLVE